MSAVLDPPPIPRLAPEWQDWLAGNVVRGCTDADMLSVMRDNGCGDFFDFAPAGES